LGFSKNVTALPLLVLDLLQSGYIDVSTKANMP
jgi:hypothetical protein